jgi:uncharacterized cysteine cluster protein YcgN (CxxCxxCC family)
LVGMLTPEFWKKKKLTEMNPEEWEALCDGCARCCLYKLQDEDTDEVFYTNRSTLVPTCLVLTPELVSQLNWMPKSCAYRLLAEGKDLEPWHPLISGDPNSVHAAGISVRYRIIEEKDADMENLEDYVVDWLE